ncbi:MAG: saccharopine dehydrogenase NADP-binding domain-containing protein [Gammaproteobacteria bacterium]|nr:saccharopine dehydrogenase NADP-binding domain-containing protein [Gammaproteobacteria bacterium]MCH9744809.1 saccharopine dehydrogenase NADP-binding domain-containing protein [Gammaproteobacteria bacterium]
MQHRVLIAGAGKIGTTISHLLARQNHYDIFLIDNHEATNDIKAILAKFDNIHYEQLDITNIHESCKMIQRNNIQTCVCCLPFQLNIDLAKIAIQTNIHYFNLTEDVDTSDTIKKLATNSQSAIVQHCGVAPGLVNIIAHDLAQDFDEVDSIKCRVGALPENTSNALQYAITWSIDGLINECCNACPAIEQSELVDLKPMSNLEEIQIDGANYEAFNTSGGLGDMISLYENKINELNYKTIRYPGHCDRMNFLLTGLKLNQSRDTLKKILLNAIPSTTQDVVIVYASVSGKNNGKLERKQFVKKYYPREFNDIAYSAIQITTATGLCSVLDTVMTNPSEYKGITHQYDFKWDTILNNRFGAILK